MVTLNPWRDTTASDRTQGQRESWANTASVSARTLLGQSLSSWWSLQLDPAKGSWGKELWEEAADKRQDWVYFANLLLNCSEPNNCFTELCRTQNQISGPAPTRAEQQRSPAGQRGCAESAQGWRVVMPPGSSVPQILGTAEQPWEGAGPADSTCEGPQHRAGGAGRSSPFLQALPGSCSVLTVWQWPPTLWGPAELLQLCFQHIWLCPQL